MKKLILIIIVLLIVVVAGGATLASVYAQTVDLEDPVIKLFPESGRVLHKSAGTAYAEVTEPIEVSQGDSIQTNQNSKAKLVFFDNAEMILDQNTEIVISRGFIDKNSPLLTRIRIKLEQGQVWSRLLELLHPDADYSVEADNVVATVRGTSFNFSKINGKAEPSKIARLTIKNKVALTAMAIMTFGW